MISKYVILNSESEVVNFVNLVSRYSGDVDMIRGRYVVDAKSILGVLGLGVGKRVEIQIHQDESDELLVAIKSFLVE